MIIIRRVVIIRFPNLNYFLSHKKCEIIRKPEHVAMVTQLAQKTFQMAPRISDVIFKEIWRVHDPGKDHFPREMEPWNPGKCGRFHQRCTNVAPTSLMLAQHCSSTGQAWCNLMGHRDSDILFQDTEKDSVIYRVLERNL